VLSQPEPVDLKIPYMRRRQLKKEIIALLAKEDLQTIFDQLQRYSPGSLLNPLFISLCHNLETVRWHAVCAFGRIVPAIAENDLEAARVVMRRFLWMLNDESGGIGWGVPESMAEIMCYQHDLRDEYLHMLISYMRKDGEELHQDGNYLELPLLQRGLLWGVARLCGIHPQIMKQKGAENDLLRYLDSPDHQVVAMALKGLSYLNSHVDEQRLRLFSSLPGNLSFYNGEIVQQLPFSEIASWFSPGQVEKFPA
jgi:hypothetical protein